MRKLIIQVPCYDEESTLGTTLDALPREVEGFDVVEWLVVDDGSTDGTADVARQHGADHVLRLPRNQGLARAQMAGLDASVSAGADVIVTTDADNQYDARDIPRLVAPILAGEAEIVVGARPIESMEQYPPLKRALHRLGTWVVQGASRTRIPDAPSGFRALTREAAMQLNVFSAYTYTLETIIQAGQKGMAITSVPVRTNPDLRPSRLVRSVSGYVRRSVSTIVRIFMAYRPFEFFAVPGAVTFVAGFILGLRFLWFWLAGEGQGHVQSVILAALLMGTGFLLVVIGLIADLISVNRKLLEKIDWRLRVLEDDVARGARGEPSRRVSTRAGRPGETGAASLRVPPEAGSGP